MPVNKNLQSSSVIQQSQTQIKLKEKGLRENNTNDRWIGWFRPSEKGIKFGPLIVSSIVIDPAGKKRAEDKKAYRRLNLTEAESPQFISRDLVVSVPRVCGTSVQRNRFRRIVKARFAKCVLKGIRSEEIVESQENIANKSLRVLQSRKGLWIRLLNRHRLGQKILVRDWQKIFDTIEDHFCSK